jgi:cytochrome b
MAHENLNPVSSSSPFIQSHSAPLRIWHWLTFLFISAAIITVLINSTILSPRENVKMVQEQLERKGLTATEDQAFAVSHEYEEIMWDVHKYIGYALAFLLLARLVIEIAQPTDMKMRNRFKKAAAIYKQNGSNKAEYRHYLLVKISYMVFFTLLFILVITGLGMAFGRDFGMTREFRGVLKNVHEIVQYLMYAFVFIHLSGVILAETGKIKGLVSGMINGNRV